jgi:hypothetical protein
LLEVPAPRDVGIDMWRECRLHRTGKALPELADEHFRVCAKRDAGKHNPGGYSQRHNGNRHCCGLSVLAPSELPAHLVGARLHKVRNGQQTKYMNIPRAGFTAAGLICPLMQSLSLQSFPCSHASLLSTIPLSGVATGEGCDHLQCGFVHFSENLQSVGD